MNKLITFPLLSFSLISGSSPAAPPPTTMIMEGLETLVTPSHHAYLLTESAAAAHFNVLSFDTCSFLKTAATTAGTYNLNNNNHSTANNNHSQTTQLINSSSHHHQHQHQQHMQHQQQQASSTVNTSNSSNTSSHSGTTSVTQSKSDSTNVSSSPVTTTTSVANVGHHNHPTLNIQETQQQAADRNSQQLHQSGDLNTPVTTSSDIPSFFGPSSVVVEPPIITGEICFLFLCICFYFRICFWWCGWVVSIVGCLCLMILHTTSTNITHILATRSS